MNNNVIFKYFYCLKHTYANFVYLYAHLKMILERSKRRDFLSLAFIVKLKKAAPNNDGRCAVGWGLE